MSLDHILPAAQQGIDSPFLPGTRTQYAWDSVSLTSILSCPMRYRLSIIEGWKPKGPSTAIALTFGIAFHKGLETFHNQRALGQTYDDAIHTTLAHVLDQHWEHLPPALADEDEPQAASAGDSDSDLEDDGIHARNSRVRTRYHLARALVWYLEHYRDDPCQTFLLPSGAPAVELSFRAELPLEIRSHPLLLSGHIDRVVRFNERIHISDYKTTKSLTSQFFAMFDLSHQMTGYYLGAAQILPADADVRGIIVDGIALQVGGVKFARHVTTRTPGQISEYLQLVRYAARLSAECDEADDYPLNTASCYFCDFKPVCARAPEYRKHTLEHLFTREKSWNPLENR